MLTTLIVVIGLALSVAMGAFLARESRVNAEREFSHRVELVSVAVNDQVDRYIDTLGAVAAALGGFTPLNRAKFNQATGQLPDVRLAGSTSIVFLVPATLEQGPAVQSLWRARGAAGLVLHPVGNRPEHVYTIFATILSPGVLPVRAGVDASQVAAPATALEQARRSGQVTVSDTYSLILERGLPTSERQLSFVLIAPVNEPADAHGHLVFRGWVLMGIHGPDFMGATLQRLSQRRLDVTLKAQNADQGVVTVAALRASATGPRDLGRVVPIDVANHRWQLNIQAHAESLPGGAGGLARTVTGGGSVLALLLAALVYVLATGRARARTAVKLATVDLREQNAALEQTETELRAREAELTVFASMVAHDLKAPLRAVDGFTQILRENLATAQPDGPDATSTVSLNKITTAAQRMRRLIDDLLSFATARDRTLGLKPVDLQALVAEVITERTSHQAFGGDDEPAVIDVGPLPTVRADPVMGRQLLDNLIGNALKYVRPGEAAALQISAHREAGPWVRIEIADRGVGIPADQHEKVFESFHRAHSGYTGTGLGLAICRRIVERHGGTIAVSDNPGGGSRFQFTLPSCDD